jgi:hypothetical protein
MKLTTATINTNNRFERMMSNFTPSRFRVQPKLAAH